MKMSNDTQQQYISAAEIILIYESLINLTPELSWRHPQVCCPPPSPKQGTQDLPQINLFLFSRTCTPWGNWWYKSQALTVQAVPYVSLLSICSCSSPLPTPTSLHRDADLNQVLKGYTHSAWGERGKQDLSDLSSKDQTAEQHAPSLYWTVQIFCVWEAQCQHEKLPLRTAAWKKSGTS